MIITCKIFLWFVGFVSDCPATAAVITLEEHPTPIVLPFALRPKRKATSPISPPRNRETPRSVE